MRILIIDDDPDLGDVLAEMLADGGHHVEVARTAAEGMQSAREFGPRLVFTDLNIRGQTGLDLARQLRSDPATSSAYLVALTGADPLRWGDQARAAGFDRVLRKPVAIDVLLATVREAG